MAKLPSGAVALSEQDLARAKVLQSEIKTRLSELRQIVEQTLGTAGKGIPGMAVEIGTAAVLDKIAQAYVGAGLSAPVAGPDMMPVCFCNAGGCGCLLDPPGICIPT